MVESLEDRTLLSTFPVTSLADSTDAGTLRAAITQANQLGGDNTITFQVTGTITLLSALPDIASNITIAGPGATQLTVSGNKAVRVFLVDSGVTAAISGLTISGGSTSGYGGGIANGGTLTVTNCTIASNTADDCGGGVFNYGTMTVTNSTISTNRENGVIGNLLTNVDFSAGNSGFSSDYSYATRDLGQGSYGVVTAPPLWNANLSAFYPTGAGFMLVAYGSQSSSAVVWKETVNVTPGTDYRFDLDAAACGPSSGYPYSDVIDPTPANLRFAVNGSQIGNRQVRANGYWMGSGGSWNSGTNTTATVTIVDDNESNVGNHFALRNLSFKRQFAGPGGGIDNFGTMNITSSIMLNNSASITGLGRGGAIADSGVLTVANSTIANNSSGGDGAGVANTGTTTITNTIVANNSAGVSPYGGEGAIYNDTGTMRITNSTIDNTSGRFNDSGTGIYNANSGTIVVANSTIANNSGSGIHNLNATMTVTNSTIASNSSVYHGGGILNEGWNVQPAAMTITNSTIAHNSTSGRGGGIWTWTNTSPTTTPSTMLLYNTIVALNTAGPNEAETSNIFGTFDSVSAFNLIGTPDGGSFPVGNGNLVGIANPGLSALAHYGGPTQTIALLPGSPAINAGSNALAVDPMTGLALTSDQRGIGFPRIADGTVDIGAFEVSTPSPSGILTSSVNPLPERETSLNFSVTVTGFDSPDAHPWGLTTFDIYASTNGGPWSLWTTVPAANPTTTFTGQGNTTYAFYSIAHDLAGNTEVKSPAIEASTFVPDLIPPVTSVNGTTGTNPSTVDASTGTLTLKVTGTDTGGSGLASFQVFVVLDSQAAQPTGSPLPAGTSDSQGVYHATLSYKGLIDGASHTYRFYSTGTDGAGNVEAAHSGINDVSFTVTFGPAVSPQPVSFLGITPNPRNTPVDTVDVTFNTTVDLTTIGSDFVSLTRNGGPNLMTSPPNIIWVSTFTYRIGGLTGLTGAEGNYTLNINASALWNLAGTPGNGSLSITWFMDTTPPTSRASAPASSLTTSFRVTVIGSDPAGKDGSPASGIASYDIYEEELQVYNGPDFPQWYQIPWQYWTTVTAANPTAIFTGFGYKGDGYGQYSFYSRAHDLAGNTEGEKSSAEASTNLPYNLPPGAPQVPPVTSVNGTTGTNPSTVDASTGTFTLNVTGSDTGGSGLASFQVYVAIDNNAAQPIGSALAAGTPDSQGYCHATLSYTGLIDGVSHTYRFYSTGIDVKGNVEAQHGPPGDVIFTQTFVPTLQATSFTVERGAAERSYIRYVDLGFNASDSQSSGQLSQIVGSIGSASPRIQLYKYDLNGTPGSKTPVSLLAPAALNVIDHVIEIDFGAGGLGGKPGSTAADGYYELDLVLPNNQKVVHHFYRLVGDVTGDGLVDNADLAAVAAAITQSSLAGSMPLNADVNGDGTVNSLDAALVARAKGHKLGSGLVLG